MATRTADSPDQSEGLPGQKRPVSRVSGHVEPAYWSLETGDLVGQLETSTAGLLSVDAAARRAMEALRNRISRKATVLRDSFERAVDVEEIVPGDVVCLSAGNLIPVDGVILESRDFNVSESVLTGETFPVVKSAGRSAPEAGIAQRSNAVFTGTSGETFGPSGEAIPQNGWRSLIEINAARRLRWQ